jgi:hypothetical protein
VALDRFPWIEQLDRDACVRGACRVTEAGENERTRENGMAAIDSPFRFARRCRLILVPLVSETNGTTATKNLPSSSSPRRRGSLLASKPERFRSSPKSFSTAKLVNDENRRIGMMVGHWSETVVFSAERVSDTNGMPSHKQTINCVTGCRTCGACCYLHGPVRR